jgi:hypothetical protein
MPSPLTQRDYFAELYVAGIFGDAGWSVYFPKRDVGFDFVISKPLDGSTLIRPVQVKGLYPTPLKKDRDAYGFLGNLTALHDDMVLVIPYFSAIERGAAPETIAYMPLSQIKITSKEKHRCVPAALKSGIPRARRDSEIFFDNKGLLALSFLSWGK